MVTNDRDIVLNKKELFTGGGIPNVSRQDAQFQRLSVVGNQVTKLYDYYLVTFKMWNRGTDQSVEGE